MWEGKLSPSDASSEPPRPKLAASVLSEWYNPEAYTTPSLHGHLLRISSSEVHNELVDRDYDLLPEGDPRSDRTPTDPH